MLHRAHVALQNDSLKEKATSTVADALQRIAQLRSCGSHRIVLGIAGAPGSGKSTLAALLNEALGPEQSVVVPMDGFHLAQRLINGTPLADRRGAIDTFDGWGYANLIGRIAAQEHEVVYAPSYERSIEDPIAATIEVTPTMSVVITEGNYLLVNAYPWRRARELLTEAWFVESDDAVRAERLVRRHVQFGKTPDAARRWVAGPDAANAEFIRATRHRADYIFVW